MPEFELIPRQQAMMSYSTRSRSDAIRECSQFIEHLGRDEAGKLTPSDGETVATVRRRLGSAVKASGKNVQINRLGAEIFFWEEPSKRRGGRPRKNANPDGTVGDVQLASHHAPVESVGDLEGQEVRGYAGDVLGNPRFEGGVGLVRVILFN